ncbi:MAG: M20/M25/M40 family metallo-hydrolase, partial [Hoeflea sp.]
MTLTDPAQTLAALIRCPSVTPEEGGALTTLSGMLAELGFANDRVIFSDKDTPDVENLYSRLGSSGPHLMFAGHTDVVPVGDADAWTQDPFSAAIVEGEMYG